MAFNISIGDVMLLSSLAWKVGRAFTSGRGGAPAEFLEVKNELDGLAGAIVSLCNSLEEDGSLLARSDDRTKEALDTILDSCRQTLENLESLVKQYQEVIKPEGEGGGIQRKWTSSFIRNYKKMWWTSEGGNIQDLRNMLHMHVQSISVTMQALQSRSLARLERTVEPMAKHVEGIHDTVVGNIDVKIAEMHNLMMTMASPGSSPWLGPIRQGTSVSMTETLIAESSKNAQSNPQTSPDMQRKWSQDAENHLSSSQTTPEMHDSGFASWSSPILPAKNNITSSDLILEESELELCTGLAAPHGADANRWSTISDELPSSMTDFIPNRRSIHNRRPSSSLGVSTLSPCLLPPPAIRTNDRRVTPPPREGSPQFAPPPRYSTFPLVPADRTTPESAEIQQVEGIEDDAGVSLRRASTISQQEAFQAMIFTDAATVFEGDGASVDYTQADEGEEGGLKMVEACSSCRISIVTKGHKVAGGNTRYVTSIWALSGDRTVRLQQKLADGVEIIPYTIWGNEKKVVVRISAELRFHALSVKEQPLSIAKTDWINYVFESQSGAVEFQNALMGKRLLHTFKTRRTLRMFDNLVSTTFAYQEQLCGLENMRLWSDDDEGDGSVLAMIQYSANFKEGYLAFRLRGPYTTVQIKDDGEKWVKVKGLEVSLAAPGTDLRALKRRKSSFDASKAPKPKNEKKITGVKIEFDNVADKNLFLDLYKIKPSKGRFTG